MSDSPVNAGEMIRGSGEMCDRVRAFDWGKTALGSIATWPMSLRTAVNICLNSRLPMFVWSGAELINIHNDAYVPVLGQRHPDALGKKAREIWAELWPTIGEDVDRVMQQGIPVIKERVRLVLERNGYPEETYFTYSHSPIIDEHGKVAGLFQVCTDETARVKAEGHAGRLTAQRQLALDAAEMGWWHYDPVTKIATFDERYTQIFGVSGHEKPNEEILKRLHPDDLPEVWKRVEAALDPVDPKPFSSRYRIILDEGVVRWVEAHGLATFEGEGAGRRAISFVGTVADITDRNRAEEQSRLILESITEAFFAVDREWRFTYVNKHAEEVLDRKRDELLGKTIWAVYPGLIGSEFEKLYRKTVSEGARGSLTSFYPHHNRWYEVHVYPADDGLSIYFRDVTEKEKSAKAVRELADKFEKHSRLFEQIASSTPDFIYVFDLTGHFLYANSRLLEVWGTTYEEAIGKSLYELGYPKWHADMHMRELRQVVQTKQPIKGEVPFTGGSGISGIYEYIFTPVLGPDGNVEVIAGTTRDVTERRATEATMARDSKLLANVGDSVIVTDLEGVVTFWNEGATRLFGWTAEEMVGRPMVERLPEETRSKVAELIRQIASGEVEFSGEWKDYRKDGSRIWIEASTRLIGDASGKSLGIMGVSHDISERKRAETEREELLERERTARSEAEHASKMKDEFLATLSHELRTPLNAILGWATILNSSNLSETDLRDGLETIQRNARAQTQIIEDLLDMSRIISGKIRLDVQRLELAEMIEAALDTVKPAAEAKGVELVSVLDSNAVPISGDPNRLQQIFWNLLNNAVKFTGKGGKIQVQLERVESHLEITVADTGEGVRADFLPHVFDRFRQGDASTTRQHGGLGLGLAIAKQLAELHGGTIKVKSPGVGQGSTFTVVLPVLILQPEAEATELERRNPAAAIVKNEVDSCPQVNGVRVLVVDDEADARAMVKRLLEDCDAKVRTASTVEEAMALMREERPDVLVSDIGMPGEDGYTLIRQVRALGAENGGAIPAVALTAYARTEDRVRAIRAGFQTHIVKPVEAVELITVIASLAGRTG